MSIDSIDIKRLREPNPTLIGSHPTVKKTHKAIIGALLIAEKPLRPYRHGNRTLWTLDFLAPSGPVWDPHHPLIINEKKLQELLDAGFVVTDPDGGVYLTRGGAIIAEDTRYDWIAYWDIYYDQRFSRHKKFDWVNYFQTGVMTL